MRSLAAAALAAALLVSCGPEPVQRQPHSPDDGLHATGRLDNRQVSVTFGEPSVLLGPCDAHRRPGTPSLCIEARTIDGETFGIVIENPGVLETGEDIDVRASCPEDDCALVEVRRGEQRYSADGGQLVVTSTGERYAARFLLRVGNGTLSGAFDVVPRRPW